MIRPLLLACGVLMPLSLSAGAALHVWRGTVSERFSDARNWEGGSPEGDSAAELSFPPGAPSSAVNDLPNLRVKSIALSGDGITISGNAISFAGPAIIDDAVPSPNVIACDLVLAGPLTIQRAGFIGDAANLTFSGAIGGTGDVLKYGGGRVAFAGSAPNTYAGTTHVRDGELRLVKTAGIDAVPGNVVISGTPNDQVAYVLIPDGEQIADAATVTVGLSGHLQLGAVETIGRLVLGSGRVQMGISYGGTYSLSGRLVLRNGIELEPRSQASFIDGPIVLAGSQILTLPDDYLEINFHGGLLGMGPADGLTIRGPAMPYGRVGGNALYTGPTIVEGGTVTLTSLGSAVIVRGGAFGGNAGSIDVESGTLMDGARSQSFLRLSPAATVAIRVDRPESITANGPVDLGGATATFEVGVDRTLGRTYTILSNTSASPTTGTFAGLPEGAVIDGRFRISYVGGTGNDVTLTEVGRYASRTVLRIEPSRVDEGQPARLSAVVTPLSPGSEISGTVTFFEGATALGSAPLGASNTATMDVTLPWGEHSITARFEGTAEVAPSEDTKTFGVLAPKPVITAIEPAAAVGGQDVDLVVRGTNFKEGAMIFVSPMGYSATFVSASELRATIPLSDYEQPAELLVQVRQPGPCCVVSDPVPLHVTPRVRERSPLVFETRQVSAPVVPGATSAWLAHGVAGSLHTITIVPVVDDDRDGWARLPLTRDLPSRGIWTATDVTSGRLMAGDPDGDVPLANPFPAKMFLRDPAGDFSHVVMGGHGGFDFLWVRPGVGAWRITSVFDGGPADRDGSVNGQLVFSTTRAIPLPGSPPVPAGVQKGDVWVALAYDLEWFGGALDAQLDEASGPGVLELMDVRNVDENAKAVTVTIVRSEGTDGAVSVQYATRNGTALAGVHYQPVSGTLAFGPGEVLKSFEIPIIDDEVFDGDTAFELVLSEPAGAALRGAASRTIAIREDDPMPELSIGDATIVEGDAGIRQVTLPVTLAGRAARSVTLKIAWEDPARGSGTGETVVFAPGETRKTVTVPLSTNTVPQPDRVVRVSVAQLDHARLAKQGFISVIDDDFAALSISDASVDEHAGTATVWISLSHTGKPATLRYETRSGSAQAGADFAPASGTLKLRGALTQLTIPILDDAIGESPEYFSVVLSDVAGAHAARTTAVVNITDDESADAPATLAVHDASIAEGDAGTTTLTARVVLSKPATAPVTVAYATADGTAAAGSDYLATSGTLTFAAGEKEKTVAITILGDILNEATERFTISLGAAAGVTMEHATATIAIVDDDGSTKRRTSRH